MNAFLKRSLIVKKITKDKFKKTDGQTRRSISVGINVFTRWSKISQIIA
jgi:hypothetical protein